MHHIYNIKSSKTTAGELNFMGYASNVLLLKQKGGLQWRKRPSLLRPSPPLHTLTQPCCWVALSGGGRRSITKACDGARASPSVAPLHAQSAHVELPPRTCEVALKDTTEAHVSIDSFRTQNSLRSSSDHVLLVLIFNKTFSYLTI